ncbi:MAG TPA: hypothetical protein VI653_17375 [Steroidobacteraceae bacterium]
MKAFRAVACVLGLVGVACVAHSAEAPKAKQVLGHLAGVHDFDFEVGSWSVHHRVKRAGGEWFEFDGTCTDRSLMFGAGNVEEHVFNRPEGTTSGVGVRAYDPKSAQWAIWWIDGRDPHGALDPPVKGRFENGVGRFYSDGTLNGRAVRTRFTWSGITATSARWEQAYSWDGGNTWETNWYMDFTRIS